jgi:histidinol-phosphatase (PHP family)
LIDGFYSEAKRLRDRYGSKMDILIGFESEWIRSSSVNLIEDLLNKYDWDFFVGSVHHVHTIPIDFDVLMYREARSKSGGTDEKLFEDYFDAQYNMLQAVKPPIVGHFDLIRLFSDKPDEPLHKYEGVWRKILRNLEFVQSYGGVMELSSAALRKGLAEPYPSIAVCKVTSSVLPQGALLIGLGICRHGRTLYTLRRCAQGGTRWAELSSPASRNTTGGYQGALLPSAS